MEIYIPDEIQELVFAIAAKSDVSIVSVLSLVSSHVREWVELVAFETVVLWSSTPVAYLDRLCSRPPEFLAERVLNIWINSTNDTTDPYICRLLPQCTGLLHLAIQGNSDVWIDLTPFPHLRSVSITPDLTNSWELFPEDKNFIFSSLTHIDWNPYEAEALESVLPQLPVLTHVMLPTPWTNEAREFEPFLLEWASLPQITTFVIFKTEYIKPAGKESRFYRNVPLEHFLDSWENNLEGPPWDDEKIIWVTFINWDFLEDWKKGCYGENDFWSHLEILRQKGDPGFGYESDEHNM